MKISYDFPNCFLSLNEDVVFCDARRYKSDIKYRQYFQDKSNVILGFDPNSPYVESEYEEIIYQLAPKYYFLPYMDNMEKQLDFHRKGFKTTPIATPTGRGLMDILASIRYLDHHLPKEALISIPCNLPMLENNQGDVGYFTERDIPYQPLRMAVNRKLLLKDIASLMIQLDRKACLFGCFTVAEFDDWGSNFDKSFITNLITSHPITMTLEGPCNHYTWGFFIDKKKLMPMKHYCPNVSINQFCAMDPEEISLKQLAENINYFTKIVQRWSNDD